MQKLCGLLFIWKEKDVVFRRFASHLSERKQEALHVFDLVTLGPLNLVAHVVYSLPLRSDRDVTSTAFALVLGDGIVKYRAL